MKKFLYLTFLIWLSATSFSQNFTWAKGSSTSGLPGVYGTMGVPAPANDPGGRHGCGTWTDASGNLWLFGGEGYSNNNTLCWMNDLWKYNATTNQWTWIRGSNGPNAIGVYGTQGVASPLNEPGAREFMVTWTDATGNFWMFGGDGFAANATFGKLGDLWKYNPTTNQWTWMKGFNSVDQLGIYGTQGVAAASNLPGCRYGGASWISSSGDLWMFGGRGWASVGPAVGYMEDLWKYNPASNQWTWVKGTNTTFAAGIYGTQNVSSPANNPGARVFQSFWIDAADRLYIFGGLGTGSVQSGYLNDLWRYDPVGNAWTWVSGSFNANLPGVYGTIGVSSAANFPGGRYSAASWMDASGNLWLFGGAGYASVQINGELNDLFKFNPGNGQWTWMKGANVIAQNGTYGTIGVPAITNIPGARHYNSWWTTQTGNFWLLGGEGYDISSPSTDHMNDLWMYLPPCNPDSIKSTGGQAICSGNSATLTAFNQYSSSVVWYSSSTSTTALGTGSTFSSPPLTAISSPSLYTVFAEANSCTVAPRTSITITVNPLPALVINGVDTICSGTTTTLMVSGASNYTWNTTATTSVIQITPTANITYVVIGKNPTGCENSKFKSITVLPLPLLNPVSNHSVMCKGESATLTAGGATGYTWSTGANGASIAVTVTASTAYTVTGIDIYGCLNSQTLTQQVNPCTGIQEYKLFSTIVYPNPNNGEFTINLPQPTNESRLVIMNILGEIVFEEILYAGKSVISTHLVPGIYHCRVLDHARMKWLEGMIIIQ